MMPHVEDKMQIGPEGKKRELPQPSGPEHSRQREGKWHWQRPGLGLSSHNSAREKESKMSLGRTT